MRAVRTSQVGDPRRRNHPKLARDTEGPPRSANIGYGRQFGGYERKDPCNYRDRENRSPKDRSPQRQHKGNMATVGRDPLRRSRSRSRSRESRADESSSRHYARRIRVNTIRPSPTIEQEPDKTPLWVVVERVEEIQILTRS
jgi:hypothetical protein